MQITLSIMAVNFWILIIILHFKNVGNHGPYPGALTTMWLMFPCFTKWEFDFGKVQTVQDHMLKWEWRKNSNSVNPGSLFTALPVKLYHLGSLTVHWKHFQGRVFIYTTLSTINICLNLSCSRPINTLWYLRFKRLGFLFMQC